MIKIVENLIGTFTSSFIGIVIPQYPVGGLFLPFLYVGVIFMAAFHFVPSFLIKYVLVLCSPFFRAEESQTPTFWITTSPEENIETLFFPTSYSLVYPNNFSPSGFIVSISPSKSHVITLFMNIYLNGKCSI